MNTERNRGYYNPKESMNISIIVPSLKDGGAERAAGLLSKYLSLKHNIFLFLLDTNNIVYEYGGTIVDIGKTWPFYGDEIVKYKKKYDIDVSISFMEEMNVWNIRTRGKEKVIISERCAHKSMTPSFYYDEISIERWYEYADEVIACSYGVQYELENYFNIKTPVKTIYNFINKERVIKTSGEKWDEGVEAFVDKKNYYVNIGRLHLQKRQMELIKQFSIYINKSKADEKLLIFGNGELKTDLEQAISDQGMENHIKIFSYDVSPFRYIKKALALISTSRCEGLPNVILESFCLGIPVIASDCLAGPRELLDDNRDYSNVSSKIKMCKRGVLMPFELYDGCLYESIIKLKEKNVRKKIVEECLNYASNYRVENIMKQWCEAIDEIQESKHDPYIDKDSTIMDNSEEIIIYGAGKAAGKYFERFCNKYRIIGFAVSEKKGQDFYYNLPVKQIDEYIDYREKYAVIVGTDCIYANEIVGNLKRLGFKKIVFPWK